jgi:hypothetical protein
MKRPSDLTVAELKVLGPAAVAHAGIMDFTYDVAELQKKLIDSVQITIESSPVNSTPETGSMATAKSNLSSIRTPNRQRDKLKA